MNKQTTKLTALALAALMLLSSFWVVATAAPAEYSTESNSGKRGEVCLSLEGTGAESYYTGNYAFDSLAAQSPSNLKSSLHDLMTDTHKKITSYADCRDYVFRVDCEENDTTHATTLYTSYSMTKSDWSPSWACNREHVWPQSLGGNNTSGGGADLHHIRPAEAGVNSSRGNKPYGETTSRGYYEPADHVKGDVARIILYVYVRWDASWGATDVTKVFESVDILLAWCEMDPVDTWEMGRNEVVESIQGNRNTFIDYPELAWLMFGREVPEGMITPSGSAMDGEIPTYPPETETNPADPDEPETDAPAGPTDTVATFTFGDNGGAAHNDGTEITGTKSFTDGDYTLTLTSPNKLYGNARDAKGNSCLKLGSSKDTGGFSFTVPEDVKQVVIHAARYKANKSAVMVNGTRYGLETASNDGAYTPLVIDTSKTKTVTVATVSGSTRCMINTIEFIGAGSVTEPETEVPTEAPTEEPTEKPTGTPTESPTEEPTEAPTEAPTETPTEATTEQPTAPSTEEVTTEAAPTESETEKVTDKPAETDPTTSADTTAEGATETDPADTGCGSVFAGGVVMISLLGLGVFAVARKRKDDCI